MKLLTINTHSLIEDHYEEKLRLFAEMVNKERPEIIAMQEVNQEILNTQIPDGDLEGFVRVSGFDLPIKEGNHAAAVVKLLHEKGLNYYWTWISAKIGYDKYDEGLAILSLYPIIQTRQIVISHSQDYHNWKTRKCLGIQIDGFENQWFYTVHMGWWDDKEEPFSDQFHKLMEAFKQDSKSDPLIWLMGDFNSPDTILGQGYEFIKRCGWHDTYRAAVRKDSGITVGRIIDGWHERTDAYEDVQKGLRLDYIFTNKPKNIISSEVVFNRKNYPVVSDHYGIMIQGGKDL